MEDGFCYKFRLFALKLENNAYSILGCTDIFKGTTLPDVPTSNSLHSQLARSQEHIVRRYVVTKPELIDVPGPRGMTPLAVATYKGDKSMVNILLSAGANVDLGVPSCGRTPLQLAVFNGFTEIAKILILKKANVNKRDCIGLTFGHYAIDGGYIEAIKFAINNGADVEAKDDCGWTLLLRTIVMKSGPLIVRCILEQRNCNLFATDNNKLTAIELAKVSKQTDVVELLNKFVRKRNKMRTVMQMQKKLLAMSMKRYY